MCSYILECIHIHKCAKCQILVRMKWLLYTVIVFVHSQRHFPPPPLEVQRSYKPEAASWHSMLLNTVLLHIKTPLYLYMGIYFIYNLIQCIHTKIFGIRQDKLWSIALCYISANAVAYMCIYVYIFSQYNK